MTLEQSRIELINIRKKKGISQRVIAEKMGISLGMIHNYEQGIRNMSYNACVRYAEALDGINLSIRITNTETGEIIE